MSGAEGAAAGRLLLVKWGGSLITDKRTPETARPAEIARLAAELAEGLPAARERGLEVVLGHGSGSFGHVAAARHGIAAGLGGGGEAAGAAPRGGAIAGEVGPLAGGAAGAPAADPPATASMPSDTTGAGSPGNAAQLLGVAETQAHAAALHRLVLDALAAAGVPTFSIAPSSMLVVEGGRTVAACFAAPVARALAAGLVPVVYGDVATDLRQGVAIASTERVFGALVDALPALGWRAAEALWLGDTPGVLDAEGLPVVSLSPADAARLSPGGAAGTDVTGGMAHRLRNAVRLAERGVPSTIADGRRPGLLRGFLATGAAPGTRVAAR